jgi:Skp family chaperone for outer membrane proteins
MSKKNNDAENGMMGLGEISTIRNILMGEQINETDSRFKDVEKKINKLEEMLLAKIAELQEATQSAHQSLSKETNQQLASLENHVNKGLADLDKKFEKVNAKDRKELGKLFGDVSRKLLGE